MRRFLLSLVFVALTTPALAVDGVLEINQTCAVQTGCFSGDAAGFPVTIDSLAGKSYRLTSDLNVGDPNTGGIVLETARVSIDFNGFSLVGFPLGSGTGDGISGTGSNGSFASFATLSGGSIRGFRDWAIDLGGAGGVRVEDMVIDFNSGGGIELGDAAQVVGNRLSGNGSTSGEGILLLGEGGVVSRNSIVDSGQNGIFSLGSTMISENIVQGFGSTGIVASNFGNSVQRCTIRNDGTGTGIVFGDTSSSYQGNTISAVTTTVAGGRDTGGNVCNSSLTCP